MAGRAQTIVVGYNGSGGAKRALDRAADFAGYGTSLVVVNVASPSRHSNGRELLDEARMRLNLRLLAPLTLERVGDPVTELVEAARELHADLLVVGDGKDALEHESVSARLAQEPTCDVLVVR